VRFIRPGYDVALVILFSYSIFIFPGHTRAQSQKPNEPNQSSSTAANSGQRLRINEISAKAARHFATHFSTANNEKWTILDGFYIASFSDTQVRTEAFYTVRGNFAYCVKYYGDGMLNQNIRLAIMKKYEGHKIDVVTEISNLEEKLYFIKIKSSTDTKTLKILNGEIEVEEEFRNDGA
jgi:hypothetical protein